MQFKKISMLPPHKGLEFLGGGGFFKTKTFKEMYEAKLKFPEGWEGLRRNHSWEGRYTYGHLLELHSY